MNDLPTPALQGNSQINTNNQTSQSSDITGTMSGGIGSKEKERGELPLTNYGNIEMELPKEVASVGVSVRPTTVTIPKPVQQMGVTPTGTSVPIGNGATVTLPLTDDQIADGLHLGFASSWRWLAEWCIRRLKQTHVLIKVIHGKIFRTS